MVFQKFVDNIYHRRGGGELVGINVGISERMTGVFGHFFAHINYDSTEPG